MGAQRTPGPFWPYARTVYAGTDADPQIVGRTDVPGRSQYEAEANACLFAAAPDLLIQLEGLLGLAKFIINATDIDAESTKVTLRNNGKFVAEVPIAVLLANSEAAIAKATGAAQP